MLNLSLGGERNDITSKKLKKMILKIVLEGEIERASGKKSIYVKIANLP